MIDVTRQIDAVSRTVATREVNGEPAKVASIRQGYDTDRADLWEAVTSATRLPRWFLPVTGDLVVGGRYQLEGNACGTITACTPTSGFDATWEYGEEITWIEVRLEELGPQRTELVITHISHVDDDRWEQYGPGAVGVGWDLGLIGLALHIGSGATVDPVAVQHWTMSPAGRGFMTDSSENWFLAAVVGGEDPVMMREAADRTTAFYTGDAAPS